MYNYDLMLVVMETKKRTGAADPLFSVENLLRPQRS